MGAAQGRWDRIGGVLALVASVAVVALGFSRQPSSVVPGCEDLGSIASPAERDAIRTAFEATGLGYARTSFATVDRELTRYADALAQAREQSCAQAPERLPCLDRRAQAYRALITALGEADASAVTHAVSATLALADLAVCGRQTAAVRDDRVAELEAIAVAVALGQIERAASAIAPFERDDGVVGSPSRGLAALLRGRIAIVRDDLAAAAVAYEHAVWSAIEADDDETAVAAALALAKLAGEAGTHDQAQRWWRLAAALVQRSGAFPRAERALLETEVELLLAREAWEAALAVSWPGIELGESVGGPEDPALIEPLARHALAAARLGRGEDARLVHTRVDRSIVRSLGEGHPLRGRVRHRVGRALLAGGRPEDAARVLRPAATDDEGLPAGEALARLLDLGRAGVLTDDRGLAREAFTRARTLAGDSLTAADAELGLALVAEREADGPGTIMRLETALALLERHAGSTDAIVDTHVELARALAAVDRRADATRSLEQAIALSTSAFGTDDPRTTSTHLAASTVLLGVDEPARALEVSQHALESLARAREPDVDATVQALTQIGWSSLALGRDPIAAQAFEQARGQIAEADPRWPSLLLGLASALWRAGDREDALAVTAELERGLPAQPPDVADALARDLEAWLVHRGVRPGPGVP